MLAAGELQLIVVDDAIDYDVRAADDLGSRAASVSSSEPDPCWICAIVIGLDGLVDFERIVDVCEHLARNMRPASPISLLFMMILANELFSSSVRKCRPCVRER